MTIEQSKKLTIEDLKQIIVGIQKDAEQANMPAAKHQMRMQLVQLRLQQLDSYTLVNTEEYENQQKYLLSLELKEKKEERAAE